MSAKSARPPLEEAQKATKDAVADAERAIADLAKRTETVVRESVETLRVQAHDYADIAGDQFETAQQYIVDRVNERPVAAALTALGIGFVLGVLIAGRNR